MHRKRIILINGSGLKGKDTLITHIGKTYPVLNVSSVDKVKEAAEILGWDGGKTPEARKLLSDIKLASIAYNDFPLKYTLARCDEFSKTNDRLLFIHIREPEEIEKTKTAIIEKYGVTVITLKIDMTTGQKMYGNPADDNVDLYSYDFIFMNDFDEDVAKRKFLEFMEYNIIGQSIVPFMDFNSIKNPR